MALEIKQSVRLSQQLVITPQLQQAIKLLQLSRLELNQLIQNELLENPILEDNEVEQVPDEEEEKTESEKREEAKAEDKGHDHTSEEVQAVEAKEEFKEPPDFDWENYANTYNSLPNGDEKDSSLKEPVTYESTVTQTESLSDHLTWQLHMMSNLSEEEQKIGELIIGNINEDGYLVGSLEDLAKENNVDIGRAQGILYKIQEFDPIGVGARDIRECLLLQIKVIHSNDPLMRTIVENNLSDLEKHNYPLIAKKLSIPLEEVEKACNLISMLEPKPGRAYGGEQPQYIIPDVFVMRVGNEYTVTLNDDGLPKLQISRMYRQALMKGSDVKGQTKNYIQEKFKSAMWLIKSIYQRQRTIHKVAESIVKFQRDFFDEGISHLKPLVLKDIADDIGMHESTVSRVTTNKYMHTPRGIFELKFFFNSGLQRLEGGGVASEAVKAKIRKLVQAEDPKAPLSDEEITKHLRESNIDIARRTVAKYRELINILPSSKRKKH